MKIYLHTPLMCLCAFIFVGITLQSLSVHAQTFCNTVGGTGYDFARDVIQTTDGGYAIAGYSNSFGAGGYDFYIVKLDNTGALQWTRTVGGTGTEVAWSIVQTTDGGYVIGGYTDSFGAGGSDLYIVKLDASGTVTWTRTVGGAGQEYGYSIIQTTDGGYAMAARTSSYGAGSDDVYIVKLNSSGTVTWTRTVGGWNSDTGYSIDQTTDGGYIVSGQTPTFGQGGTDIYIMRLNSAGTVLWTKTIGGTSYDNSFAVVQTTDGGYITGGRGNSFGAGFQDVYITKLNSAGTLEWTKTIGGTANDYGWDIIQTGDGGYAVAGQSSSYGAGSADVYIVKLDNTGSIEWTRTAGGASSDDAYSVFQTTDGGYVLAGATYSFGAGNADYYIVKLDASGNTCCSTGSGGASGGGGIASTGGTYSSGGASSSGGTSGSGGTLTVDCAPLPIELLSFNANAENNKLVKTEWATASEINNDYFSVLRSKGGVDFEQIGTVSGAGNSTTTLNYVFYDEHPYTGISYYQLKQTDYSGASSLSNIEVVYIAPLSIVNVYPNPADGSVNVVIGSPDDIDVSVAVYNSIGQKVIETAHHVKTGISTIILNVEKLASGDYLFRVVTPAGETVESEFIKR